MKSIPAISPLSTRKSFLCALSRRSCIGFKSFAIRDFTCSMISAMCTPSSAFAITFRLRIHSSKFPAPSRSSMARVTHLLIFLCCCPNFHQILLLSFFIMSAMQAVLHLFPSIHRILLFLHSAQFLLLPYQIMPLLQLLLIRHLFLLLCRHRLFFLRPPLFLFLLLLLLLRL